VFDEKFLVRLKSFGIFIAIYTLVFFLFFSTISYTLPFVLAFIIALITRPLTRFLRKKLRFPSGLAALISTLFVFVVLFFIVSAILVKITTEAKLLLTSLPNMETTMNYITKYIMKLQVYYEQLDPSIVEKLQSQIATSLSSTLDITVKVLNALVSFAIGLPMVVIVIFITLLATFFISKDMPMMQGAASRVFSPNGKEKFRQLSGETTRVLFGYARAYGTVITLGFLETLIGFSLLRVKYALLLSILAVTLDVLPILGIAAVYFPLSIFYFIKGKYVTAIGILILYVIVTIVRQIVEPKLVSSSLGLHPVAVLAAIFIGLKAYGFLGMIYLLFLMVFYNIFRKVDVL
jgi:sporulation integral membrane protein YtvI